MEGDGRVMGQEIVWGRMSSGRGRWQGDDGGSGVGKQRGGVAMRTWSVTARRA